MHLSITTRGLILLTILPSPILAWGTLGHTTVAYIASSFVSPSTTSLFQYILYNNTDDYLANIATWADSFRYTEAGRFSAPLHYIDAKDDPPQNCGVEMARDCGSGRCIVGAIGNYTRRLLDPGLAAGQRNMAAKFIVHFLGDIHQPLHTEALLRGGNSISVNFSSKATNLHHVWDTSIPELLVGGYSRADARRWADSLTTSIRTGVYKSQAASWLDGMELGDPEGSALVWATQTNKVVCEAVLPAGREGVEGMELSGSYYENAVPVVELQVAKAGFRLGRWLDLIAQGGRTEL